MRTLCIASALAFVLVTGCRTSKATMANALHGDFIAALKSRHWSEPDAFETCVLELETTAPEEPWSWDWLQTKFPGLERGTYDSFSSENERARPIAPLDRGAMKLHVLTRAEDAEFKTILYDDYRSDYWDIFRARYGNAVRVGLSAPGFSGDRKQALIYYEAGFDWLAAWGCYCLLKREGDRWEIVEEHGVWES